MSKARLEVCCADIRSLYAAREGGGERIELCTALSEGGLTPSAGLLAAAVGMEFHEINVLIRPRKGDFLYSKSELDLIEDDIRYCSDHGATGIVFGALDADGNVDAHTLRRMRKAAVDLDFTFHRAFDMCADASEAFKVIMEEECTALLTSGLAPTAYEGIDKIAELVRQADEIISIIAGCGVNSSNCREIVERTRVTLVHATASRLCPSEMRFRRDSVSMGAKGVDESSFRCTSEDEVRAIINALQR